MARLYVCNYGPSGNLIGSPIYSAGRQCSACPDGTSCSSTFPGLCSSVVSMSEPPMQSENEISNEPFMNGFRPMIQKTTERVPSENPTSSQPLVLPPDQIFVPSMPSQTFNGHPTSLESQPMTNFIPSLPAPSLPAPASRPTFSTRPRPRPQQSRPTRPVTSCNSFLCLLTRPGAILMDSIHQAMSGFRFP